MIQNVIILLIANTLIPLVPLPPTLLLPLPLALPLLQPASAFQNMNLSRLYSPQQFKKVFRQSIKTHHPDHGGSQEVFQQIQGLKKIMLEPTNYYDLYNVTNADLEGQGGMMIENVVSIKSMSFYVQFGIFYFITILYLLAFTIDDQAKGARKYMLFLALATLGYEYYMHQYPQSPTIIDFIHPQLPLFTQRNILKRSLIIILAIIRSHFMRRRSQQKIIAQSLQKEHSLAQYKDLLERLNHRYLEKAMEKDKYDKSIWAKLRSYISKGISVLFILLIAKNMIGL